MRLSLSLIVFIAMSVVHNGFVLMEKAVPEAFEKYILVSQPDPQTVIELIFHVRDKEGSELQEKLMSVSDPKSKNYGEHLTKAALDAMLSNPEALKGTMSFLHSNPGITVKGNGHSYQIHASAAVAIWEPLLNTKFHNYEKINEKGEKTSVIRGSEYSLPEAVAVHVNAVFNTVQFPTELTHKLPAIRLGAHQALPKEK